MALAQRPGSPLNVDGQGSAGAPATQPPPPGCSPDLLTLPSAGAPTSSPRTRVSEAAGVEGAPASRRPSPHVPARPLASPPSRQNGGSGRVPAGRGFGAAPRSAGHGREEPVPPPGRPGCQQPSSRRRGACGTEAGAKPWRWGAGGREQGRHYRPRPAEPRGGRRWGRGRRVGTRGGRRMGRGSGVGWEAAGAGEGGLRCRASPWPPALWALSPRGRLRWRAAHPARSVRVRARFVAGGSYLCLPFLYRPPSCCGAVAREMPGVTLGRGVLAPSSPRASLAWGTGGSEPRRRERPRRGLGRGRLRARARPSPRTRPRPRPLPLPAYSGLGGRGSGRAPGPAFPPDPRGLAGPAPSPPVGTTWRRASFSLRT